MTLHGPPAPHRCRGLGPASSHLQRSCVEPPPAMRHGLSAEATHLPPMRGQMPPDPPVRVPVTVVRSGAPCQACTGAHIGLGLSRRGLEAQPRHPTRRIRQLPMLGPLPPHRGQCRSVREGQVSRLRVRSAPPAGQGGRGRGGWPERSRSRWSRTSSPHQRAWVFPTVELRPVEPLLLVAGVGVSNGPRPRDRSALRRTVRDVHRSAQRSRAQVGGGTRARTAKARETSGSPDSRRPDVPLRC